MGYKHESCAGNVSSFHFRPNPPTSRVGRRNVDCGRLMEKRIGDTAMMTCPSLLDGSGFKVKAVACMLIVEGKNRVAVGFIVLLVWLTVNC